MSSLLTLLGYGASTWPQKYSSYQLLGLEVRTDEFRDRGLQFGDRATILKTEFATFKQGDLVVVEECGKTFIEEYHPARRRNLVGRIIRSWRNY